MHQLSQIKAKRVNSEEWVTGFYCEDTTFLTHKNQITPLIIKNYSLAGLEAYEIDPKTICRPIDLTLNGQEVYEGDIFYDRELEIFYSVEWSRNDSAYKMIEYLENDQKGLLVYDELFIRDVNNLESLICIGNVYDKGGLQTIIENFQEAEDVNFSIAEHLVIKKINEAKQYVKGELELNQNEETGDWYALDYREDLGQAFSIRNSKYENEPLFTNEWVLKLHVDLEKCFNACSVACVGDLPIPQIQRR